MATAEMEFDPSKRDFLTFAFARRRRSGGGQPPRRGGNPPSTQAELPDGPSGLINRRNFLRVGSAVVGTGVGLFVADRLGLLGLLPESDKRKMGRKLENLQFNTQEGKRMEKDRLYQLGKISVEQSVTNYELTIDGKQFTYMADKCGVNNIPEVFQIIISERYASFNNQGQPEEQEAAATSDGSMITIFIGLDTLFVTAAKLLDQNFEVSPEKRAQAQANFEVLDLNRTFMRIICSAAMVSDLDRKGASLKEAQQATETATLIADEFMNEMLNGKREPAIIVARSSKGFL